MAGGQRRSSGCRTQRWGPQRRCRRGGSRLWARGDLHRHRLGHRAARHRRRRVAYGFRGVTLIQKDFTRAATATGMGTRRISLARSSDVRSTATDWRSAGVTEVLVAKVLDEQGVGAEGAILAALQWVSTHPRRPDVICIPSGSSYAQVMAGCVSSTTDAAWGLREYLQQLRTSRASASSRHRREKVQSSSCRRKRKRAAGCFPFPSLLSVAPEWLRSTGRAECPACGSRFSRMPAEPVRARPVHFINLERRGER